jgi:hypothetical protein
VYVATLLNEFFNQMLLTNKPTLPKKRVGDLYRIVPGTRQGKREIWPLCDQPSLSVAKIQYGTRWYKLLWSPVRLAVAQPARSSRLNEVATEFLRQPSTVLMKGPLHTNLEIYGDAFMLQQTKLLPYVKIDRSYLLMR